ncbi:hypothetical protein EVG18_06275 [Burkholderia pyrrocinia]|nr:hypothetical protein EVG18_06275 [Burkholderia pyrrocinia]
MLDRLGHCLPDGRGENCLEVLVRVVEPTACRSDATRQFRLRRVHPFPIALLARRSLFSVARLLDACQFTLVLLPQLFSPDDVTQVLSLKDVTGTHHCRVALQGCQDWKMHVALPLN